MFFSIYIQNTAYKGIDLMLLANPKLLFENRIEYLGLYLSINTPKLLERE